MNPEAKLLSCASGVAEVWTGEPLSPRLADGGFLWLDIPNPEPHELEGLATDLHIHPLVVEDAVHFGQRPKVEDYDGFIHIVAYGAAPAPDSESEATIEVHCILSTHWLITIHNDAAASLEGLRDRLVRSARRPTTGVMVLHGVLDVLTDTLFPVLERVDRSIDAIEERLADGDGGTQQEIFHVKRRLMGISRIAGPQRDMLTRLAGGLIDLPGATSDAGRYLRDVADHAIRVEELADAYRELLSGATEVHLASVSNRLNGVMAQLTLIATIFMPLTFLTGFFGQNFGWLVDHVGGLAQFLIQAVAMDALTVVGLVLWFRRRGWMVRAGETDDGVTAADRG